MNEGQKEIDEEEQAIKSTFKKNLTNFWEKKTKNKYKESKRPVQDKMNDKRG